MMSQPIAAPRKRPRLNPILVWRWGFTVLLIAAGIWLILSGSEIGGASGSTLGWVIIGYAVLRLGLGHLADRRRRPLSVRGTGRGENPLD